MGVKTECIPLHHILSSQIPLYVRLLLTLWKGNICSLVVDDTGNFNWVTINLIDPGQTEVHFDLFLRDLS